MDNCDCTKGILQFKLPEHEHEFKCAINGELYKSQIEDVWQILFRPRHKHGFDNVRLTELLNGEHGDAIGEYLDILEDLYFEIRNKEEP